MKFIVISDSSTYLYIDSITYFDLTTTPIYYYKMLLVLLYYDPSCCPLTVPNYYRLSNNNNKIYKIEALLLKLKTKSPSHKANNYLISQLLYSLPSRVSKVEFSPALLFC